MRNSRILAIKTVLSIVLFSAAIQAQTVQRCDLVSKDTTINGQPAKQCLDVASLKNQSITIPSNVTRIDNQGLALCTKAATSGGDADIIFILDQSSSMGLAFCHITTRVPPARTDTVFYSHNNGCRLASTTYSPRAVGQAPGANVSPNPITVNTAVGPRTVWNIIDTSGCNAFSGDPYKVRAGVVSRAIDAIAASSVNSTIGYLPFANTIQNSARSQRPLTLTTANITAIKAKVIIDSADGTNYTRPLDSAKRWLNTPLSLGRNSKRAIVFISDGSPQPADSNGLTKNTNGTYTYLDTAAATRISIYSIYLGDRVTSDTAILKQLADITRPPGTALGANFYRVPPSFPDSISGVMKSILNKIITSYTLTRVTVTNTSVIPNVTSNATLAAQFVNQGNGNYKVVLDSAIPLQVGANIIRLTSQFTPVPTVPPTVPAPTVQNDTTTFTLNANGATTSGSTFLGGLVSKCFNPTTLQWRNAAGVRPPSGYFTDSDLTVQVFVSTSKNGLASIRPLVRTAVLPPDTLRNLSINRSTDSLSYPSSPISIARPYGPITVRTGNDTIENKTSDTLKAFWKNPRDPRDTAGDVIPIHPTNKQAFAYFSHNINGTDTVTFFDTTVTQAFIVVRDQIADPTKTYTVTLRTFNGVLSDQLVKTLVQRSPGLFSASITLSKGTKNASDTIMQFSAFGDQMTGDYTDPVNLDQSQAVAGIGQVVQFASKLFFTDATGNILPSGTVFLGETFWSLTNPRAYLRIIDNGGTPNTSQNIQLTATSYKLGQSVAQDSESISSTSLTKTTVTPDISNWSGSINLGESVAPVKSNGTLQGAYKIIVVATAPAHDKTGAPNGIIDTARITIAFPDSVGSLGFTDAINPANPQGPVSLIDTLRDQHFVHIDASDKVTATVTCLGSSATTQLNFTRSSSFVGYISDPLYRDTLTPNSSDTKLICPQDSGLVVNYTDPVYGTTLSQIVPQVLAPTATPQDTFFSDGLNITLQSGTDGASIYYTTKDTNSHDAAVNPLIGPTVSYNGQIAIAGNTNIKVMASKPGYLRSRVNSYLYQLRPKILSAYVKDLDRDGRADAVYITFEKRLPSLPVASDSLQLYWNDSSLASLRYPNSISFLPTDSFTVLALLNSNNSFAEFLTGYPLPGSKLPLVKFNRLGTYFNGAQFILQDSVGPVPFEARKHPSDLKATSTDTLVIKVSEKLKPRAWDGLFRFRSGGCDGGLDSGQKSAVIPSLGSAILINDTTYKVLIDKTSGKTTPVIGDCIYLETIHTPSYTDTLDNNSGKFGVALQGNESPKQISTVGAYPPVAGLNPGSKSFNFANQNSDTLKWVPPVDFPASWTDVTPYTPVVTVTSINDTITPKTLPVEPQKQTSPIPHGISTLKVVSSSKYIANVRIFDHLGHFIKTWRQQFGFQGELNNYYRTANGGKSSFLVWDQRDTKGQSVGSGVYIWKVNFQTTDSTGTIHEETRTTKAGLVR